jgi:hypothetical protein
LCAGASINLAIGQLCVGRAELSGSDLRGGPSLSGELQRETIKAYRVLVVEILKIENRNGEAEHLTPTDQRAEKKKKNDRTNHHPGFWKECDGRW